MKKLVKPILFVLIFVLILTNITACTAGNNIIEKNFNKNYPWEGTIKLKWDSTGMLLKGYLDYTGEEPLKELRISADYKKNAWEMGLPQGYKLPYENRDLGARFYEWDDSLNFKIRIYDKEDTYQPVKRQLTTKQAELILENIIFHVNWTDINGVNQQADITVDVI